MKVIGKRRVLDFPRQNVVMPLLLTLFAGSLLADPLTEKKPAGDELEIFDHYKKKSHQVQEEISQMFSAKLRERQRFINDSINEQIKKIEVAQREYRMKAIEEFEKFLSRHPDNPKYTPDAMFRLAELYYEQSYEDFLFADEEFEKAQDLYRRGKIPELPKLPEKDYSKSINLYKTILERYPLYRYADVSYYLLGFCLSEMEKEEEALRIFEDFAIRFPDSVFIPEVWIRTGEFYFNTADYDNAVRAFSTAMNYRHSKFFEMAVYKLAWSYFQKYDYTNAIYTFKSFIELVDSPEGKKSVGAQFRQEAIDYLAGSLAEDDWDGDGDPDPNSGVPRALSYLTEGKPYEREIIERYADTLFNLHEERKYKEAVEVYRELIRLDPLHKNNPLYAEKIIQIYDILKDFDKGLEARNDYVSRFSKDSEWYRHNWGLKEVIRKLDRQTEVIMRLRAQFYHQKAQDLKLLAKTTGDENYNIEALAKYRLAADAYKEYLKNFPDTRHSYEMTFILAEALYYSFRFLEAAGYYAAVRDFPDKTKTMYHESSAFSAIDSIEKEIQKMISENKLPPDAAVGVITDVVEERAKTDTAEKIQVPAREMPELTRRWISEIDKYIHLGLNRKGDPSTQGRLAYMAALEFYKYRHLEEARRRFVEILEKYPGELVASYAAANIVNSYKLENDWENIEKWANIIEEKQIGRPEEQTKLKKELKIFKLGAQFKQAEKYLEEREYLKAAEEFVALVEADPNNKLADKALYNAAIAYQTIRHYDSAAKIFEKIATEPQFKNSQFVETSLLQLAENSKKFYDFDRAIMSYLALVKRFPQSENASYALYTAATLMENDGRLMEAALEFERYRRLFPAREDAGLMLFKAADIYSRLDDKDEALRLYIEFYNSYSRRAGYSEKIIESLYKSGEIYAQKGNAKESRKYFDLVIKEFHARGLQPNTPVAKYPAKVQFGFAEEMFKVYKEIRLKGTLAQQGEQLKKKKKMLIDIEREYSKVFAYQYPDWTAAALYRSGYLYQEFAQTLYDAPIPEALTDEEKDIYITQLEDEGVKYENIAIERYIETISKTRELNIVNDWTVKTLESLNKYRPSDYPLFKEDKRKIFLQDVPDFKEVIRFEGRWD